MPSVYTHYLFADKCIDRLPHKLRTIVSANRKFYDIGQSGADILFYYKPYKSNNIRQYGSAVHRVSAKILFEEFRQIALESCTPERDISYLAGYFTHFILDSTMHPYIWDCDSKNIAAHFVIEADYDRELLLRNGLNPFDEKFLDYQQNDEDVRQIMAKYMHTAPKVIDNVLKSRKSFTRLISSQNRFIRGLLKFLFKISKNPKGNDILIQKDANPACAQIRADLDALFVEALDSVTIYGAEFEKFLFDDGQLSNRFDKDFE